MTSKRGRKKNITNANNKSVISLREMLEKDIDNLVVNETLPLIANNEKRRQQRSVINLKQLPTSLNVPIQNDSMPSTSGSSTKAISSQYTEKTTIESSIKQKKFDEFNDLLTKYIKSNANTQSILEKILEEQLRQRTTIEVIEKSNTKLKCEIFENRKLIQEIFTNFTVGPLNTEQTQQEGKVKQQLKRKDMKHIWWECGTL
ncbi:hypothetical protein GLOIN_2v1775992 [Rhizophagus irregularis DAOM 181602=DAOM 197198]|nr:hypothetical protein GLOIN_2v1775992 [Rhizophagus irregularis DAOM 181602=DAOM 197198]